MSHFARCTFLPSHRGLSYENLICNRAHLGITTHNGQVLNPEGLDLNIDI